MKTPRSIIPALAALLLAWLPQAHARNINWSSGVGDIFLQADGVTAMDSSFGFELGGFTTGFTPTQANFSLWQSNWIVFDTANTGTAEWSPGVGYYSSTGMTVAAAGSTVTSSITGATFTIGQQAYLWAFNTKTIGASTQWAMIANTAWTYPASDPFNPNDLLWDLQDPANTAVAGATSVDTVNFVATLQAQPVPEPGSALLVALAGVLIRLRRRYGR
ncbi:MAG: PEP-CTERM sorting domain-containing protein [Verrucomicrobiaceae bacterium]|nr:PEP-CTERM sorting domain-containing protein [Verrucomicrobiaceae bacterium]